MPNLNYIDGLLSQMVPGGEYDADRMRFLLNAIKDSVYAVFWVGQTADDSPAGNIYNASAGFHAGSLGYNPYTKRKYICIAADATSAIWVMVGVDYEMEEGVAVNGGVYVTQIWSASASLTGAVTASTLRLPSNPYTGKRFSVYSANAIGTLSIESSDASQVCFSEAVTAGSFVEVQWNGSIWTVLFKVIP